MPAAADQRAVPPVLRVSELCKSYARLVAVDHVSFDLCSGEILGLLGPNGAGKTTTINMILGVLAPTSGTIHIAGVDLARQRPRALARTSFAAVYATLPGNLTVSQNLRVFGLIYDVKDLSRRIESLLDEFDLGRLRNTKCGLLSSGEQTRVALAKAMLNRPELLLLDEPTAYLDPHVSAMVTATLAALRDHGTTIIYTSHNMREVETLCNRIIFLSRGRVIADGQPLQVTQTVLRDNRSDPALGEVFMRLAGGSTN